jgi:hypothetical protein
VVVGRIGFLEAVELMVASERQQERVSMTQRRSEPFVKDVQLSKSGPQRILNHLVT